MVDLETLGTTADAPVLEVAAVVFDEETGKILKEFDGITDASAVCQANYEGLCREGEDTDIMHCGDPEKLKALLQTCPYLKNASVHTLEWWIHTYNGHSCWCRDALMPPQEKVILQFLNFMGGHAARATMYCKGMFDFPILSWNLKELGVEVPWKFWKERDLRTIIAEHPDVQLPEERADAHDALSDCRYQIQCLSAIRGLPLNSVGHS